MLLTVCLVGFGLPLKLPALAHPPHEHVAGHFQRADGKEVTILEAYVDGILFADPQSTRFQLADGTIVASTPYGGETLAWVGVEKVDLYTYGHGWLPVATQVRQFDGYTIKDEESAGETAFSFWVHWQRKWPVYGMLLGGAALIRAGASGAKRIPRRYPLDLLRWLAIATICLVSAAYTVVVLLAGISPPLLAVAGLGLFLAWRMGSRLVFQ